MRKKEDKEAGEKSILSRAVREDSSWRWLFGISHEKAR